MIANPDPLACLLLLVAMCFLFAVLAPIADYFADRQHARARAGLYDQERDQ